MNSRLATSVITIDQAPSLKSFALADILSLSSGLLLKQSVPGRIHALVGYLTGTDPARASSQAKDAKACLEAQLPFLKTVDFTPLHGAAGKEDRLRMWFEIQMRKFGAEHYLMPQDLWQRRRNSHKL